MNMFDFITGFLIAIFIVALIISIMVNYYKTKKEDEWKEEEDEWKENVQHYCNVVENRLRKLEATTGKVK